MRDVAIVSFTQSEPDLAPGTSEVMALLGVITDAITDAGIDRSEIGFTCSGSADYLTGGVFTFVQTLEAAGAWPPISESHVEMDGAWALYEAWVRLQHGDVDIALVYGAGRASATDLRRTLTLQLDPYHLAPLGVDQVSLAALQADAVLEAHGATERDLAEIVARCHSAVDGPGSNGHDVETLLAAEPLVGVLRAHDIAPAIDGAAAIVLVAGDRARELRDRPAWIRGIDHRIDAQHPGLRDLSSAASAQAAGDHAGVIDGKVDVAELMTIHSHEEIALRAALGLAENVSVNPSGGPLVAHPMIATGLIRIGEVARRIHDGSATRGVGHATSGPCLQQNLVAVIEGE